jgi:enterobacterial common antigen flippase
VERILRVTAAMGLSSFLTIALGAVRYKFIATELGAPGVGLLGILTSAMSLGVVLFSLGLNTSGVQATAAAGGDEAQFQRTRTALLVGSRWLGGVGGLLVVLLGLTLGPSLLPKPAHPVLMVWLGVALAANVISGAQLALLNGTGKFRALVKSNAWGSVIGTLVTIAAVYISGQAGLVAALAAAPLATLVYSSWFLLRGREVYPRLPFRKWWPELHGMLTLGGAVTLALLLGTGTQLIVRVWLQQNQGLLVVGYFQAAWTITSLYLGFVLMGLAAEYYPRISAQSAEPSRQNASVDDQIRLALLLGAPVLLWMMVLSPFALHILYAADFQSATSILRWQLFGDILKIVGWAVGFLLLARKAHRAYFLAELSWNLCYVALALALTLPSKNGLYALGVAYSGAYALYVLVTLWLAHRETRFILQRHTFVSLVALLLVGGATLWSVENGSRMGLYSAVSLASGITLVSLVTLLRWRERERRAKNEVGSLI